MQLDNDRHTATGLLGWFLDRPIGTKMLLGAGMAIALLFLSNAIQLYVMWQVKDQVDGVLEQTQPALTALATLDHQLEAGSGLASAYLLTGDEDLARRLRATHRRGAEALAALERVPVLQDAAGQRALQALRQATQAVQQSEQRLLALRHDHAAAGDLLRGELQPRLRQALAHSAALRERLAAGNRAAMARIDATWRRELHNTVLGGLLFGTLIGLMSWLVARQIRGSLRAAVGLADSIAAGRLDNPVPAGSGDESGQLLRALGAMQDLLRQRTERDRRQARENERLRVALDSVTANVVLADTRGRILYVNRTARALFEAAAGDIRQAVPDFDPARLKDTPVARLLPGTGELQGLDTSRTLRVPLGGRVFQCIASPVRDQDGQCLGVVVEWIDRTQQERIEEQVQHVLAEAGAGHLGSRLSLDGCEGFYRRLAEQINQLLETNERVTASINDVMAHLARGDLTHHMEGDYQGVFAELKRNINASMDKLGQVIADIRAAADEVREDAGRIAERNQQLNERTQQQAAHLETTAASMEQLTATVQHNAENAREATALAGDTQRHAEDGGRAVQQAVAAMAEIDAASQKIADIIGVIDDIAFQTNLLALNAAVEAARAGEQGRGFAVVATEVRNLAQRSAEAAHEIKALIEDSVQKVADGSARVDQSGAALTRIIESAQKVSRIISEISSASDEQSLGIEQANRAIVQIDQGTQQNATLVRQTAEASEHMGQLASRLGELVDYFRVAGPAAAGGTAGTPAPRAPQPPAAAGSGWDGVERRSKQRPWSQRPALRRPASAPPAAGGAAVTPLKAPADGDEEWESF